MASQGQRGDGILDKWIIFILWFFLLGRDPSPVSSAAKSLQDPLLTTMVVILHVLRDLDRYCEIRMWDIAIKWLQTFRLGFFFLEKKLDKLVMWLASHWNISTSTKKTGMMALNTDEHQSTIFGYSYWAGWQSLA